MEVGGVSLVGLAVRTALEAGIENVLVVTDGREIEADAIAHGAVSFGLRPPGISGDSAHMFLVYKWAISKILEHGHGISSFMSLLPTNPLRKAETVRDGAAMLAAGYDWVFSLSEVEHHPYRAMRILDEKHCLPMFDLAPKTMWANRQELPEMFRFNGVYIGGQVRHVMQNEEYNVDYQNSQNLNVGYSLVDQAEATDIDSEVDLELARILARKNMA